MRLARFALFVQGALAHYYFPRLIVNETAAPYWKYVRDVAPDPGMMPSGILVAKTAPQYDIDSTNFTCGRLAFDYAATTDIADVAAGSKIGFIMGQYYEEDPGLTPENNYVWHLGPVQIYMSRPANGDIKSYRGDEDWFKVAYWGPKNDSTWMPYGDRMGSFNFTVPKSTPAGQYLVRIEQFFPTRSPDYQQLYVNCAQIQVFGPGGGTPEETAGTARFPGTYKRTDPGITIPEEMDGFPTTNLMNYQPPGPKIWTG